MQKEEKYPVHKVQSNVGVFLLGLVLIGSQIILLREFLLVFMGNELVIGLLLALWMVLSGAGAWSGKYVPAKILTANLISILFLFLIVSTIFTAFSIGFFRPVFFETGRMISLSETLYYSFALLIPVCFTGGLLFTVLNRFIGDTYSGAQKLYALESLGSLLGGVLVSFVFIYILGVGGVLSIEYLAVIAFIILGILNFKNREIGKSVGFLSSAFLVLLLIQFIDLGFITRQHLFPNQQLISSTETPYGSLDLTQTGNQKNIYENGMLVSVSNDVMLKEEDVHFAMLQRPKSVAVLLLGGGVSGTIPELLKYQSVARIDYVEPNTSLIAMVGDVSGIPDKPGIRIINEEPVFYVKKTRKRYDVILINEPPPVSIQTNRFYTVEFYQGLKRILREGGMISTRLPASENYLSEEEIEIESVVFQSLKAVFENVGIVPGKQHYFLASDGSIGLNYTKLLSEIKINTQYVNRQYLNDRLLQMRSDALQKNYLKDAPLNHDFKPSVYLYYIKQWLYFFDNRLQPVLWLSVVFVVGFLLFAGPNAMAMFSSGFTGASTEIVLLVAFQSLLGFLYLFLGLMITIFMGGLALGAYLSVFMKEQSKFKMMNYIQLSSALFILFTILVIYLAKMLSATFAIQIIFGLMMFFVALFVGLQYGVIFQTVKSGTSRIVSVIYPADMLGACLGSFITVLWLIPVFGIYASLLMLSFLHFITLIIMFLKRRIK